ncbi:MAG: DPP IV N-terminal domain-containing protein [Gemmatimonadota bacterium]
MRCAAWLATLAIIIVTLPVKPLAAQDRLRTYPGYERYTEMVPLLRDAVVSGALNTQWAEDGASFTYRRAGDLYRYDVATRTATRVEEPVGTTQPERGGGGAPARGRQFTSATSPDEQLEAFYRDRNLWVRSASGANERQLTTDGSEADRIKYGTASWVYGEELGQRTAIWWNPQSTRVAYYRFDEKPVADYYLQLDQTRIQSTMDVEAYPKAGTDNPIVDIFVYDLASGATTRIGLRDGQPFTNDVVGHYAYNVAWSPDGSELLLNRTNRRQNVMEFTACSPETGACRVIVREEWPASWTDNRPTVRWLEDGRRFIWESERTGYANYYLYDISGELLATLTDHPFEVAGIERVDEARGTLWYRARSGDNHMKLQLHRVGLDGTGDVRLTDPAFNHAVSLAPDARHFVDVAQTHAEPPVTRLRNASGRELAVLAKSDLSRFHELGLEPVELFTFTAADGVTELHGMLHKPSDFDPARSYPVLFSVYGGPGSNGARETFSTPHAYTEYGFLVVQMDARSASGKGKRALDAIYEKLGTTEIDDFAAGMRSLATRPYVDGQRVGVFGTSYGGYVAALTVLRYPDVFQAGSAGSAVTDWRHYDTIYTERYMWIPQENAAGYDAGSAMTYAEDLRGRLMIYYGTADNNVHPSQSMELIQALQGAGKSFEVMVGPDRGHSGINPDRMMEFFIEELVLRPRMLERAAS